MHACMLCMTDVGSVARVLSSVLRHYGADHDWIGGAVVEYALYDWLGLQSEADLLWMPTVSQALACIHVHVHVYEPSTRSSKLKPATFVCTAGTSAIPQD